MYTAQVARGCASWDDAAMNTDTLLSTLLSQALVAFVIEFDNEAEHAMPHRTTDYGSSPDLGGGPWLVSMVMWMKFMRFVPEEGISVGELQRLARIDNKAMRVWLTRLSKWWGYLSIEAAGPAASDSRSKRAFSSAIVRPTEGGRKALEVWRPLSGVIERRWENRFGIDEIEELRQALWGVARRFDVELPDCLPILGYALFSIDQDDIPPAAGARSAAAVPRPPLPTLLSRVLLAFAIEFERDSELSLAIGANLLRVLDEKGVRVRDLPVVTGVSKESLDMAMGILRKKFLAVIVPEGPGSRTNVARLTVKGCAVQRAFRRNLRAVERSWRERFGASAVDRLRESMEWLVGEPGAKSQLFGGLEPYPDGWRASVPKPETLPHFPMVLHRGGFPDGS